MRKAAISIGISALSLLLATVSAMAEKGGGEDVRDRKTTFSVAPYAEYFNAKVAADYNLVKDAAVVASSDFKWGKGSHKLVVKGREDGARLDQIWIGNTGKSPGSRGGKTVAVEKGEITSPMRIAKLDGTSTLIGAEKGTAIYEFEVNEDGVYNLWGRACGLDESSNSFTVQVDDNPDFVWDVPSNNKGKTQWTKVKGRGLDYYSGFSFWLAWAATSPLSKHRDNRELQKLALSLTELQLNALAARKVTPQQLWFMPELETVYMWQQDIRIPRPVVSALMAKIQPYVESCCKFSKSKDGGWADTPNIQIQAAAILRLASVMWRDDAPELSKDWAHASEDCLERAWKYKLPESAFVYSYGSGFDASYVGNDGCFLGRYYMLTGDGRVKSALKDMALFAKNTSSYGHPLSLGSPWWKHTFWRYNKGDDSIPEIILAVSEDPDYARIVELGRKRFFNRSTSASLDPLTSYYNMLLPDIAVKVASIENQCFFSKIENGPALRYNSLNVAMPWRSWCESTCGAYYSTPETVESQVCSIILTAGSKPEKDGFHYYPSAYSIVEQINPVPDGRATVCGKDFIASATSFRPALGGPAWPGNVDKENLSPWRRTDIWFADRNGFAGTLELKALQDNNCSKVSLWAHVSDNLKIDGNTIKLKGLTITIESKYAGKIANLGKVWGPPGGYYPIDLLESVLKESGTEGFKKGDTFNASVAVNVDGSSGLSVGQQSFEEGLYSVEILRGEKKYALLLFNSSKQPKLRADCEPYQTFCQSKGKTGEALELYSSGKIELPPGSLTVFMASPRK